jgi:DNA-binding CsgD family transcriptional regulator
MATPWSSATSMGSTSCRSGSGDVLRLLLTSLRPAQIARELGISLNTVRNHLKSIYGKVDVHSQAELIDLVKGRSPVTVR